MSAQEGVPAATRHRRRVCEEWGTEHRRRPNLLDAIARRLLGDGRDGGRQSVAVGAEADSVRLHVGLVGGHDFGLGDRCAGVCRQRHRHRHRHGRHERATGEGLREAAASGGGLLVVCGVAAGAGGMLQGAAKMDVRIGVTAELARVLRAPLVLARSDPAEHDGVDNDVRDAAGEADPCELPAVHDGEHEYVDAGRGKSDAGGPVSVCSGECSC